MIASRRDGEITFYEELGVAPESSPEEIREAFRLNVRLVHPDQQTDPQLKEIAEMQMRKLNRIYAVLSDPEQRRDYDEMLDEDFGPPIILNSPAPAALTKLRARLAWIGAIAVSAALLIWLASDNTPGAQGRAPDASIAATSPATPSNRAAADAQSQTSAQLSQLEADLKNAIVERDAAIQELNRLRGTASGTQPESAASADAAEARPPVTITELPSTPRPTVLANSGLPRIERPANGRMAGFWFYARPPQGQINKNRTLYPPEYIEATISEEGGAIHGSFRARYVIVDRAISPDVAFTFDGTRNGSQVTCPWTGAGGSRGDIVLKLTSENALRIDWNASDLGSLGLNSGTAVLTRRLE